MRFSAIHPHTVKISCILALCLELNCSHHCFLVNAFCKVHRNCQVIVSKAFVYAKNIWYGDYYPPRFTNYCRKAFCSIFHYILVMVWHIKVGEIPSCASNGNLHNFNFACILQLAANTSRPDTVREGENISALIQNHFSKVQTARHCCHVRGEAEKGCFLVQPRHWLLWFVPF